MRKELKLMTPSLAGGTELVVSAPLIAGFVPAMEAITYKARVKLLLKVLQGGRKSAHEILLFRALSDAVERVGVIHTVRVAVLEPEDRVMLSVSFDGAYESYVRDIWQKSSRLLDLIFCNTQGYKTGWDSSFDTWRGWLRSVQVETPFFYAAPGLTFQDQQYLRMHERASRRGETSLAITRLAVPSAERIAWDVVLQASDPTDPPTTTAGSSSAGVQAGIRQGLQSLVGLYRLADVYPPGSDDGRLLHRAAHELLPEFARLQAMHEYAGATDAVASRFTEPLAWFRARLEATPTVRQPPALPTAAPADPDETVQGGILQQYPGVSHGCLCLVALHSPQAATALLARCLAQVTTHRHAIAPGQVLLNIGFTAEGLRACGLDETQLGWFPDEFRQGMAARAGLLGDLRGNHPRRWQLPLANAKAVLGPILPPGPAHPLPPVPLPPIPLEAVHLVLQLRWTDRPEDATPAVPVQQLTDALNALVSGITGVQPLSVQWMARQQAGQVIDHFGFTDGESQPVFDPAQAGTVYPNLVHQGEVLVGYDNAADNARHLPEHAAGARRDLQRGGSYLVVRKLRQNVSVLRQAVDKTVAAAAAAAAATSATALPRDLVLAKMMGRWPLDSLHAGKPLLSTPPGKINDFDYADDPAGTRCPLAAHIRRCNPREQPLLQTSAPGALLSIPGARPARIVRRSMPYGTAAPAWPAPGAEPTPVTDDDDRGLVFMAYNASIAEQFEVVQRWISGGNSSGTASGHADPFLGVPAPGKQRHFRFEHAAGTVHMALDGSDSFDEVPVPMVSLQWGCYLFAPSLGGLGKLRALAAAASAAGPVPWSSALGDLEIARLQALTTRLNPDTTFNLDPEPAADAWKQALEDAEPVADWTSASIWAAVRQHHGGVLPTRTKYGTLVADHALVHTVLRNADGHYSVQGYQPRLAETIGPIYLGLDDGADGAYQQQSAACNAAIQALKFQHGFDAAFGAARDALTRFLTEAHDIAASEGARQWELTLDSRELVHKVLADLCEAWFGLSEAGGHFKRGGHQWFSAPDENGAEDATPLYPGHFTAPSRYTFQPLPGTAVRTRAIAHGQALRNAMNAYLTEFGASITAPITAPITNAVLASSAGDTDLAARTLVGALMGFLPTTEGSLRRALANWMQDGTLWALRAQHGGDAGLANAGTAMGWLLAPLKRSMQARPVPELIWRTALHDHVLGTGTNAVQVQAGQMLVLSLVSATQQGLQSGATPDVMPIFGGKRDPAATSPTHACPGYLAAMGVITGMLAAVLARPEALRPGPAPGVLFFDGAVSTPPSAAGPAGAAKAPKAITLRATASKGRLLGWGDSWVYNIAKDNLSLGEALAELGYDTSSFMSFGGAGLMLRDLAQVPVNLADSRSIYGRIHRALIAFHDPVDPQPLPRAVVFSGGGNDVHRRLPGTLAPPLCAMLNDAGTKLPLFIDAVKTQFINGRLAADLRLVLGRLTKTTQGQIPVLVHGYDHPVPDERHPALAGPWLYPWITDKHGHDAMTAGVTIMATLIDDLNTMIAAEVAVFAHLNVRHVQLNGVLAKQPGYAGDHKIYWSDELHPTEEGFLVLAAKLATYI